MQIMSNKSLEARKILKPDDIDTLTKMSICDRNSSFYQQQIEELI